MDNIQVGVVGAAGYTGGELLRLLLQHPGVELAFAQSRSHAGSRVSDVHPELLGETDLKFSDSPSAKTDVVFLCVGHGEAKKIVADSDFGGARLIDLSQDFRLKENNEHGFVYGLPELNRDRVSKARLVANPGCFATAIQLALLPLASEQLLNSEIHISATTGSTGAGQSLNDTSHFSWRQNNLSVYKAFSHQHLDETLQSIKKLQPGFVHEINFIPHRGGFTRGIFACLYTDCSLSLDEARAMYENYYAKHPFVIISEQNIDLKQVINTNKCIIYLEKHGNKLMIVSIIDNLLKGASGQALQNMNLMFGLDEQTGLKLKSTVF